MKKIILSNLEEWMYPHFSKAFEVDYIRELKHSHFSDFSPEIPLIISFENILEYSDLGSTGDILHLAIKTGKLQKIIYLSSYGVYSPKKEKYKESDKIKPVNFIGSKAACLENLFSYLSKRYNIEYINLRMFNAYGAYQKSPYVVPSILEEITKNGRVYTGDSEKVRDFIHINDLISLIKKLTEIDLWKTNTYNVGSGIPISIHDLIIKSQEITKGSCDIVFDASKLREEFDYDYAVADISKIRKELDWQPEISLVQGLSLTYQWVLGRSQR